MPIPSPLTIAALTLVAFADEMEFGLEQEPHLALPSVEAFAKAWRATPGATSSAW